MPKKQPLHISEIALPQLNTKTALPAYSSAVQAGFPSPADDYIEKRLDLNELVIKHPAATFYVRVEGESMIDAGIQSGDILIVDRAVEPKSGSIIVAVLNGEFTVKRLDIKKNETFLVPDNPKFPKIPITADLDFQVWGVVTYVIHRAS